ncbi:MAG: tryptophan 7-halogenase [Gammaproteobacteria bacterium]|nr:tryptophan 7-halogenase [Gammaproteobacteria bacterium]
MIKRIVIMGGGTAGWMAAAQMAKSWAGKGIEVTVIDSSAIGTVGVGEGSTPNMVQFLAELGVAESDWMSACNATYKNGITFRNWSSVPGYASYFHPFYSDFDTEVEAHFCCNTRLRRNGVAVEAHPDRFFMTGELARRRLSPKARVAMTQSTNYSYHFDATLFGQFLKRKALGFGARHMDARVEQVLLNARGEIGSLLLAGGEQISADLFVDCSGFRSLLMRQALKVPYQSFADHLLNDAAVTLATPMDRGDIPSETVSTALKHGWAWRIPLVSRFGNGYVYSSAHSSAEQAEEELRGHLGIGVDAEVKVNHLKMELGRLQQNWVKNCVAIGLAQGFVEPLEATALHFVGKSVLDFIDAFEQADFTDRFRAIYNDRTASAFDRIRDYILLHYRSNSRSDSDYWCDARDAGSSSDSLRRIIACWMRGGDLEQEVAEQDIGKYYSATSWHCLLAGVGVLPERTRCRTPRPEEQVIDLALRRRQIEQSAALFQTHRESLGV